MKTRTVIQPGKRGTKALVKEYGSQLVCVRYRYDYFNKKKYKTVELIIREDDWQPPPLHPDQTHVKKVEHGFTREHKVKVRIGWEEKELQSTAKQYGGIWSPKEKVWIIDADIVRKAGLIHRVVDQN